MATDSSLPDELRAQISSASVTVSAGRFGSAPAAEDASLGGVSGSEFGTPSDCPSGSGLSELLALNNPAGRYAIGREIARGGMGAILRAADLDLRREVAMKVLLNERDGARRLRFVEEAQITGQLEHPNIVPIHELGADSEGRVFFTMKFVRGRSLANVLDALRRAEKEAEAEFPLSRLLAILINVCNALAFAHSRGVVHRDLKPANIMLGDFGEVLVMDWGLAKVLAAQADSAAEKNKLAGISAPDRGDDRPETSAVRGVSTTRLERHDALHGGGGPTLDGAVLGTPAYMAPEQAAGKIGEIDSRSDIYAIGAILYEMLALVPPIEERDGLAATVMRAIAGQIEPPERRVPERAGRIPRELAAIALKALARDKARRYPRAEELRRDLELFLEDRAVSAKPDTFSEAAVKLVRRNKPVFATAAAAALALAVLGAASLQGIVAERNRARAELARRVALENGNKAKEEAIRRQAAQAYAEGVKALAGTQNAADKEAALIRAQAEFRQALFLDRDGAAGVGMRTASLQHFELALANRNWHQAREKLEQARQVGLSEADYAERDARLAREENARAKHIRERVKFLMDDARKGAARTVPAELARAELISLSDPFTVKALLPHVPAHEDGGAEVLCRLLAVESLGWMGDAGAVPELLLCVNPAEPDEKPSPSDIRAAAINALCLLAPEDKRVYVTIENAIKAEPLGEQSLLAQRTAVFRRRYGQIILSREQGTPRTESEWMRAGAQFRDAGELGRALDAYNQVLAAAPGNTAALLGRAGTRQAQGDNRGALADCEEALALGPPSRDACLVKALAEQALEKSQEADTDFSWILARDPADAAALAGRAGVRERLGRTEAALADYAQALTVNPDDIDARFKRGKIRERRKDYRQALEDFETVLKLNPGHVGALASRAHIRVHAGDRHAALADLDKAADCDPQNYDVYLLRGSLKQQLGAYEGAIADYTRCLELKPDDIRVLQRRAGCRASTGDYADALLDLDRALVLDPKNPKLLGTRGITRFNAGNVQMALRDLDAALASKLEDDCCYLCRAHARALAGDPDGARRDALKCLELNPELIFAFRILGDLDAHAGNLDGAIYNYSKCKTAYAMLEPFRAASLLSRRAARVKADAARAEVAIEPGREAAACFLRGRKWYALGEYEEAIADYDRVLKIEPGNFECLAARALSRLRQGDYKGGREDAETVLRSSPVALAHAARAWDLADRGEFERAANDCKAALDLDEECGEALAVRAYCNHSRGDEAAARKDCAALLRMQTPFVYRRFQAAFAKILERKDAAADALELARRLAENYPADAAIQENHARALLTSPEPALRNPRLALKVASKAVELEEGRQTAPLHTLALALFENGMVNEAIATEHEAIEKLPAFSTPDERREHTASLERFERERR